MSREDDDAAYNNSHRAFLQAFATRSVLTFADARPILAAIQTAHHEREILADDISEAEFHAYISAVNNQISQYDYEIRSTFTQTAPRERIYAFVNTTSDAMTQLATTHTPDEIAYVKRILDFMFYEQNTASREIMAIKNSQGINLRRAHREEDDNDMSGTQTGGKVQSLSMRDARRVLKSLVEEGWLDRHGEWYTLTPRALMELRVWLLDTYNLPADEQGEGAVEKIKLCQACREVVTMGQRCATRTCACRLHDHCTQSFFRMQKDELCPRCKTRWTGTSFVGPRAAAGSSGAGKGHREETAETMPAGARSRVDGTAAPSHAASRSTTATLRGGIPENEDESEDEED